MIYPVKNVSPRLLSQVSVIDPSVTCGKSGGSEGWGWGGTFLWLYRAKAPSDGDLNELGTYTAVPHTVGHALGSWRQKY